MTFKIPSYKDLTQRLGPALAKEEGDPTVVRERLQRLHLHLKAWRKTSGAEPDWRNILSLADTYMDGHGVEYLRPDFKHGYGTGEPKGAYYVNMGDTYEATLIYDALKNDFLVGSYGDFVEAEERKRGGRRF